MNTNAQLEANNINAAKGTMPFNQAAQASLRSMNLSGGSPKGPNASYSPNPSESVPTGVVNSPGPVGTPPPSPEVSARDQIAETIGQIKLDKFLNSARVKDAADAVRLKNLFNSTNPNKTPDNRNLITQVISRMNTRGSGGY